MEETVKIETQNENVDNVLKTVSDDVLKKKRKKNRIIFSVISAVVLAISIVIITLSCVKVDLKPFFIEEPSYFEVTLNGKSSALLDSQEESYDELYDLYENSFKISYLSALLIGETDGYKIEETSSSFSNIKSELGDNYVNLHFGAEQKLYNSNGKIYYSIRDTRNYELSYVDVYFPLSTENGVDDLTFYFETTGYTTEPRITKITIKANTYKLYDFVSNL